MRRARNVLLAVLAWVVALAMAFPLLWMSVTALKTDLDALQNTPVAPFTPTLDNVRAALIEGGMTRPLVNSIVEACGATALALALALPAAYALTLVGPRKRKVLLLGMLATRFVPAISIALPVYLIAIRLGLLDTQLSLILIYALTNLPIVIWLLTSYLSEVPQAILEAARLDGASPTQQIIQVVMPLCLPGVCSTALLSVILCWNEAFWSFQMTSSEGIPLSAYLGTLAGGGDLVWTRLSAASLIATAPILLLGWSTQRQFVRGLTFGAVR